ncbi:EGF-like calcium-binding [Penicillium coprophilum]|uniref:EGF-like calcium-binding n=1 Tax=Penicillium coprophilum TaxID=36646 RepID=UPI002397910D|nr:EGF-like calcium-binding [Penicillium coprophilum]KAJ5171428.1 EGF-like calcium-binding [Penicillium coprophilum]
MHFPIIAMIITTASLVAADSTPGLWSKCGTCNPISGENQCDPSTSCINTGTSFHCACRAGFKASEYNNDLYHQFRLPMPNYEFLVFVPENTPCNTQCDDLWAAPSDLCKEVELQWQCVA